MLRLIAVFGHRRNAAGEFQGDKMVPLTTEVWNANSNLIRRLQPDLRNELESIYADMGLANNLVWSSSAFSVPAVPAVRETLVCARNRRR